MGLVRSLQHWLRGTGAPRHVADVVPAPHPMRPWADTCPWAALVGAIEHRVAHRVPPRSPRGRRPVPIRVLLALALRTHALGGSEEAICHRVRPDCAVLDACGLRAYQAPRSHAHWVLPATLCALRGRLDEARLDALIAPQAAAAMAAGLVSPAPLGVDPFPCAQGSPRVTDATTLSKAHTPPSR